MPSTETPWFGVSMALAGLIVGYVVASGQGGGAFQPTPSAPAPTAEAPTPPTPSAPPPAPEAGDIVPVDPEVDHIYGNPDAEITVIEYSDFECPFCGRHHPTMKQLVENNEGTVNWVYRHFPLAFHAKAGKAGEASECAAELGGNDAFWDFSDLIFERGLDEELYKEYASELGIDVGDFTDCLDSGKYADLVQEQMDGGSAAGVRGTPGNIVVNNKTGETRLVSGAQPISAFQSAVDAIK